MERVGGKKTERKKAEEREGRRDAISESLGTYTCRVRKEEMTILPRTCI